MRSTEAGDGQDPYPRPHVEKGKYLGRYLWYITDLGYVSVTLSPHKSFQPEFCYAVGDLGELLLILNSKQQRLSNLTQFDGIRPPLIFAEKMSALPLGAKGYRGVRVRVS